MKAFMLAVCCAAGLLGLTTGGLVVAEYRPDPQAAVPDVVTVKGDFPPMLTTEQKQAVQILAQKIEIAQLRAQAAQVEFDKARTEIAALVQSLQKQGYDLDLQTLSYVPKKVPEPKK